MVTEMYTIGREVYFFLKKSTKNKLRANVNFYLE